MSIDMYVGSSQAQASSVRTMCQKQIQGYQQLQQAINQFVVSSAELQGKTYDSAKQYFSAVLLPLAKGGMLLAEATAKACQKFPDDYQSQVDSGDLKSSELEEQIRQYQQGIATANSIQQAILSSTMPDPVKKSILKSVNGVKKGQEKAKQELDKKLKKLLLFHASSPSIFSEIAALEAAVNAGAAQAGTCWNASAGTFTVPRKEEMPWITEINGYEDRAKKQAEKEKIKQLEKYNVYAVPCRDPEGKPTIMWLLEDPKSGRKVNNPELLDYLNIKGTKLDPDMIQILTLDGFEEKVAASWREGVEYFSGKEYTGLQKAAMQGLQGIQDFAESDLMDLLLLAGFAYGTYRVTTASGVQEVVVSDPKVTKVSNKNFKNATLVKGNSAGGYKKVSGASGLSSGNVGDFSNLQGTSVDDILSRIPKDANKRVLTPQPGKVTEGFEYTWKASDGTKMTVRVHGPDASAPAGSNSANGWIVRVQKGKKYLDPVSGEFQPPGISRPNSEFYNEDLINSTHIPIQPPKK